MASTVHVKNIAEKTNDKEIRDFFSFCGKITDIKVTSEGATKNADVTFERETAAKTALLLNHTKLGDTEISVSGTGGNDDDDGSHYKQQDERDSDDITQEEKPRSRILAEYLAHGYLVADTSLKSAIDLDAKHGVSQRFLTTLQNLDNKYHASDRAKATDQSYGITQKANNFLTGISSYFEKATNTPTGQKLVNFYTQQQRQVADIHNEAKRLAELKKNDAGGSAYKAAGLDKVFGAEKAKPATSSDGGAPPNTTGIESTQTPAVPTGIPQPAQVPKDTPKV